MLPLLPVKKGTVDQISLSYRSPFQYVVTDGSDLSGITKELILPECINAPVKEGDVAGKAVYHLNGKELGSVDILFTQSVPAATFHDYFQESLWIYLP